MTSRSDSHRVRPELHKAYIGLQGGLWIVTKVGDDTVSTYEISDSGVNLGHSIMSLEVFASCVHSKVNEPASVSFILLGIKKAERNTALSEVNATALMISTWRAFFMSMKGI